MLPGTVESTEAVLATVVINDDCRHSLEGVGQGRLL